MTQRKITHAEKEQKRRIKKPELPPPSEAGAPPPIIVFIASSTPEKVRDFRLIAEAKRYPIIFEDIHELVSSFHHADEVTNSFDGNANDKLTSVNPDDFRAARKNGDTSTPAGKYYQRVQSYLQDRNLPSDTKVFIASEDSGYRFEKEIWDKIDKDGIPQETLDRIKASSKGQYTGPGVETAPVVSALLGDIVVMERVHNAVKALGRNGQNVTLLQNASLVLDPINGVTRKDINPKTFKQEISNFLHEADQDSLKELSEVQRVTNHLHTKPKKGYDKSNGELGKISIINHSVRSVLVDKIYNHYFDKERKSGYQPNYRPAFRDKEYDGIFTIGTFASPNSQKLVEDIETTIASNGQDTKFTLSPDIPLAGNTYQLLSNIEQTMQTSDSALLVPDMTQDTKDKLAELTKLYTLSSLIVNKQLNPRDANKPIVILNHDGSWNNALAIHTRLANLGMTKDHAIPITSELRTHNNVHIRTNGYFDVIGTPQGEKHSTFEETMNAALELLQDKAKGYTRGYTSTSPEQETGNKPETSTKFKVAIFCSANNENKYLNEAVKNLSYNLARKNFGIIYGGGDRYTMGSVLKGVTKYRNELTNNGFSEEQAKSATYVAGYSTSDILRAETALGNFSPELNYAKQNIDIYQRMADMLDHSDVVVAAPGGAGTVQEWAAAMILNTHRPPDQKKPVIFFNPKLNKEQVQVWDVALKAVLGDQDYKLLTSNTVSEAKKEKRSKELGIYIETTDEGVQKRISAIREAHETKMANSFVEMVAKRPASPIQKR